MSPFGSSCLKFTPARRKSGGLFYTTTAMQAPTMPEPTTSTSAAGFAAFKAFGGAAGMAAAGAGLAAFIVMLMTPPRSPREWAVGLTSTLVGSICGGAMLIMYFDLHHWMTTPVGLVAVLGLVFASGLPAWALVRAGFTWLERRQGKDLGEIYADAKKDMSAMSFFSRGGRQKMVITLQRRPSVSGATIGKVSIDGAFVCYSLEDEIREVPGQPVEAWKVAGKTAIPAGEYSVTLEDSPRFGPDTINLLDVPGFKFIRMHGGNTAADTEGCPLLGMQATDTTLMGGTSRPAVALVKGEVSRAIERGELVTIVIRNP